MRRAPSILLGMGSWAVGRRHTGEKNRESQGEVWGMFAHLLGNLTVAQQDSGEEGSGRAPMLWGWGGAEGRGPRAGVWARAPLIPSRESARYQQLPASLEHPAVLGGLGERRKRSVTLWPGVFSQQAFGPCLGPGTHRRLFLFPSLCLLFTCTHRGTRACLCEHMCVPVWVRGVLAPAQVPHCTSVPPVVCPPSP